MSVSERIWDPVRSVGKRTRSEQLQEDTHKRAPTESVGTFPVLWLCLLPQAFCEGKSLGLGCLLCASNAGACEA